MSFLSAREHGAKPGSGGVASAQQEVRWCSFQLLQYSPWLNAAYGCPRGLHQRARAHTAQQHAHMLNSRARLQTACVLRLQGIDRRERLRRLALETIDLAKDPYYMRNHLGQVQQ